MIWGLWLASALAADSPPPDPTRADSPWGTLPAVIDVEAQEDARAFEPAGLRVTQLGGRHGLSLAETVVLGPSGGTNVTTVSARVAVDDAWTLGARLPFAAYRTPDGRVTDLGNLLVEGFYLFSLPGLGGSPAWRHGLGFEGHLNPGGSPYTWLHRAEELWPGGGLNLVYQVRIPGGDGLTWLLRGTAGMHAARDVEPFPGFYAQIGAAGAVDWSVPGVEGLGLVGETALTYWDLSPWEVTGLVRYEPVPGLRARGGVVLPLVSWLGWTPSVLDRGIDEITIHVDLAIAN